MMKKESDSIGEKKDVDFESLLNSEIRETQSEKESELSMLTKRYKNEIAIAEGEYQESLKCELSKCEPNKRYEKKEGFIKKKEGILRFNFVLVLSSSPIEVFPEYLSALG